LINDVSGNIEINPINAKGLNYKIDIAGTKNEIKFLTDRPRKDTTIYYKYSDNDIYPARPITLSMFLSAQLLPSSMLTGATDYFLRLKATKYNDTFPIDTTYTDFGTFPKEAADYLDLESFVRSNGLYHINVDPNAIMTGVTASTFNKFQFSVETLIKSGPDVDEQNDYVIPYSETFEFDLVKVCDYENIKTFAFLNSFGGWDWVDFIEDLTTNYSRSQALINTRFDSLIDNTTVDQIMLQNFISKSFKISRIVSSKEEYDWLYELTKASRVYFIDNDRYIPIIITAIDYINIENTNQYRLNIEYTIAQTDISQKAV
jgi:hypothetical protein